MKINVSARGKISTAIVIICLLVFIVCITLFAISYFSESVFYINNDKYKQMKEDQGKILTYQTANGPSIKVMIKDSQHRTIRIQNEEYSIESSTSTTGNNYEVVYPDGHKYKVTNQYDFMAYNEKGEWVPEIAMSVNGKRIIQKGEEEYFPSSLVIAAYPEYHSKQGNPFFFVLAFVLFIFGWCAFRYERFQKFLFKISLDWIWFKDPEPSDFYYFMSKVGGVVVMIASVVLAISSFLD